MPVRQNKTFMNWYRDAEAELVNVAAAIQSQRPLRMEPLVSLAAALVTALKQTDHLIVEALSSPSGSPLITNHVNVAILGTKLGLGLGYYGQELERLALAGLVHDVGLFAVPETLVTKAGRLTPDERMLIEQHPELGYQVIHRVGPEYHWAAQIVRQAHERINGQGYPNKLRGRQIGEMAQILGVVDVFDALVSERPYRRRLLPHAAVKELLVAERSRFPREVLKALVEQLSVYPLGTIVRLTTGESGTVVRVNIQYPLRPLVRIAERDNAGGACGTREVDLALTPLVSIMKTLNPPAVGRVDFDEGEKHSKSSVPVIASDQFTSLLESLDAIATAIQGVVETRIPMVRQTMPSGGTAAGGASLPSDGRDSTIPSEIAGLFVLEAREWLAQIQTALNKLRSVGDRPFRSKLYGFLLSGITNLAKSASTLEFTGVEAMASDLLPLLRDVGGASVKAVPETLRRLQFGLDLLTAAVHALAEGQPGNERPTNMAKSLPSRTAVRDDEVHLQNSVAVSSDGALSSLPLLSALRELQQAHARSLRPARDVLGAVIQRAEQQGREDQEHIDTGTIERILHDLDRLDEEFLRDVQDRVPAMVARLAQLREWSRTGMVASQLDLIESDIDLLSERARAIHATTITEVLQALKAYLTATVRGESAAPSQRYALVEERLNALVPMAQQWVLLGCLERSAIEESLPA